DRNVTGVQTCALPISQMEKAPFRNDIVGSFLRPQSIKNAREAVQEGTMTITDLRNIENEAIQKLVDKQVSVGLKSVTDGEFRRRSEERRVGKECRATQ